MKTFRNNGATGALLDEYEKAVYELIDVIRRVSSDELSTVVDTDTNDPDCRSIQTILTHVVRSGTCYVTDIRNHQGEQIGFPDRMPLKTTAAYEEALNKMFRYNERLFEDYPDLKLEEPDEDKKIKVRWGQRYDVEQLMEHAIVHILRHRRQIERFLLKMRKE